MTHEQPVRKRTVSIAIAVLLAVTVVAAVGVWQIRKGTDVDALVSAVVKGQSSEKFDTSATAASLAELASGQGEADLRTIAQKTVEKLDPGPLSAVSESLLKEHEDPDSRRLAVFLAEAGADAYHAKALLNRAGLENWLGRYIPKDYDKAIKYLSDPALSNSAASQFYLGQALLAEDNPKRDAAAGLGFIKAAADMGLKDAQDWFAKHSDAS